MPRPTRPPRPPRPADLSRFRIAIEPRLAPDGRAAVVTMKTVAPGHDGYRHSLWLVPTGLRGDRGDRGDPGGPDAGPRQLTLGARNDRHPRFSPDGRTIAFVSDRRTLVEDEPRRLTDQQEPEDLEQVYLLPLDGGEARRLTDLPRGVSRIEWSPDGTRILVLTASMGATHEADAKARGIRPRSAPGTSPEPDFRYIDRLDYMLNGEGFTYDRIRHIWIVDVATGEARRLTDGPTSVEDPAWSPDGKRIAFAANRRRDPDLEFRQDIFVADAATGAVTKLTGGPDAIFSVPAWLPDGRTVVALGHHLPARAGSRNDIWLLAADGSDARANGGRDLSAEHDLLPDAAVVSDVTPSEAARLIVSADGAWITFTAPIGGSYELWRIATRDGRLERLTDDRHCISGWDQVPGPRGRARIAYLRSTPTAPADLWLLDGPSAEPRPLSAFNARVLEELELQAPVERWSSVDGREIQGWFVPAARGPDDLDGPQPLVVEIHGGPHSLYGWAPVWEFQVLAGGGIGVFYANPRGSEGYGQDFNAANYRDWGPGPMRDVLAGVDALIEDGLADPDRLGVTGGSYGGYLTTWIVGHSDRFRAAMTCRSVADMAMLFLVGDISGGSWARQEFDAAPWEDPAYYREISPLSYAERIRTPLLIQHSEQDLRTTIGQAEALFTVLRSYRRPVRLLRVPEETHELTRSGTPFRRVENLEIVLGWFRHFLIDGKRGLPPLPRRRAGR